MSAEDIAAAALAGLNTPKPSVSDRNRVSNIVKDAVVRAENESSKNPQEGARNSTAKGSSDASKQTTTKKTKATKSSSPELASVTSTVSTNDKKKGKRNKEEVKFPVEPRVIQVIKKPRTYMNHSYRDFSCVPPELGDECPSEISEMTFPQKVHHMLSQEEYSKMIAWQAHGRAFRIIIPKMFETKVCPSYLQHSRYSSFLRQLSNYGFKHITQGRDRNCYYHEFMLRGLPHLCKYMPKPKDARRLIPDPENEPDFYAISQVYPLPDEEEYREKQASKPAPEDELPEAGMPRFASDLIGLNNDGLPPAKRTRTVAPDTTITASSSALPASATADLLAKLANPSTGRNQEVLSNATSLSGVGGGNLPLSASSLTGAATSLNTATSAAMGLPVGDALAAFRTPHMQAALDRNVAVLAALRARIPSQHRAAASLSLPAARNDPTATLAAALMQQANGTGAATNNSISLGGNPLGSLFGRF